MQEITESICEKWQRTNARHNRINIQEITEKNARKNRAKCRNSKEKNAWKHSVKMQEIAYKNNRINMHSLWKCKN